MTRLRGRAACGERCRAPVPPYSPNFNPIEMAFSKLKAILRAAAQRTIDGLWNAIKQALERFKPSECANYFAAAGYDAT
jgi:transposase